MDQQNTATAQSNPVPEPASQAAPPGLLTPEQRQTLFKDLGLENLAPEKQDELMQQMIDTVMGRIFARVSPSLTEADFNMIADLENRPDPDLAVNTYLVGKLPNLNSVAQEEIIKFKQEVKDTIQTIKSTLRT